MEKSSNEVIKNIAQSLARSDLLEILEIADKDGDIDYLEKCHADNFKKITSNFSNKDIDIFKNIYDHEIRTYNIEKNLLPENISTVIDIPEKISTIKISRKMARDLAEKNFSESLKASMAGRNAGQLALDQKDNLDQFLKNLTIEDSTIFLNLYTEELYTCIQQQELKTSQIIIETSRIEATNKIKGDMAENTGKIIGFLFLLFILFIVFK